MSAEHSTAPAAPGPTTFPFGELAVRLGLDPSTKTTATIVTSSSVLGQGQPPTFAGDRFRLNRAACAGVVNMAEILAAEPYIRCAIDYKTWEQDVLLPYADVGAKAPEYGAELRESFDRVCRNNAPSNADQAYFEKAHHYLEQAISTRAGASRRASFTRLIHNALDNGWDGCTAAQRQAQAAITTTVVAPAASGGVAAFFEPIPFEPSDLRPVSWLADGWLIRSELTILAAQGGGAKTALAVMLAVALAAGRNRVGPLKINTRPGGLRVAYITGEEDRNRLALLIAAACNVLALTAAERALVRQNLLLHDVSSSGLRIGAPRPGHREDVAPEGEDPALNRVAASLSGLDLLIFDTFASCFSIQNENDNGLITTLLGRLVRAARAADCAVLLLHHVAKQSRDSAAAQRGEVTLIRGASAFVNVARVVVTITSPTAAEAGQFAVMGLQPDRVRRLDHAKVNDVPHMAPAYFKIISELVTVHDGNSVPVRAVEFIATPTAGSSVTNALRNAVMQAVDAGTRDAQGARVPLSLNSGGSDNRRGAVPNIAKALMSTTTSLTDAQAKALGREVLKDLLERGCVVEQSVQMPQYKASGTPNGTRSRRGLVTNWTLAPWVSTTTAPQPSAPLSSVEGGAPLSSETT